MKKYFQFDFNKQQGTESVEDLVESGMIMMWSSTGASIPAGWSICDGTNGTPNLANNFVVCAGDSYSVDDTGGTDSETLILSQIPSHSHVYDDFINLNSFGFFGSAQLGSVTSNTGSKGSGLSHENRPKYYSLIYIMKN